MTQDPLPEGKDERTGPQGAARLQATAPREAAESFYARLAAESAAAGDDIDLEASIRKHRRPHTGLDLSE